MEYVFLCFIMLIVIMIYGQVKYIKRAKLFRNQTNPNSVLHNRKPYWIHVSGFHHSGTGVLRNMLIRDLNATTLLTAAQLHTENEGHWMQNVFPSFRNRNKNVKIVGMHGSVSKCGKLFGPKLS